MINDPVRDVLEFWIFPFTPTQIQALYVGDVHSPEPDLVIYGDDFVGRMVSLEGEILFQLHWSPGIQQAFVVYLTDRHYQDHFEATGLLNSNLEDIKARIAAGEDPQAILEVLTLFAEEYPEGCYTDFICEQTYYLIGLVNEIAGNEEAAVAAYLKLWTLHPDSIIGIMARLKLEPTTSP